MIIDLILIGGGIAYAFNQTDKSAKIDEKVIAPLRHKFTKDVLKCLGKFLIQLINSFIINHILLKMYQH